MTYPITQETEKLLNESGNFSESRKQFYVTKRCSRCGKADIECKCIRVGFIEALELLDEEYSRNKRRATTEKNSGVGGSPKDADEGIEKKMPDINEDFKKESDESFELWQKKQQLNALPNNVLNVQGSDTTEGDSSNADDYINITIKKEDFELVIQGLTEGLELVKEVRKKYAGFGAIEHSIKMPLRILQDVRKNRTIENEGYTLGIP